MTPAPKAHPKAGKPAQDKPAGRRVYTNKELRSMTEGERTMVMLNCMDSVGRALGRISKRLTSLEQLHVAAIKLKALRDGKRGPKRVRL